LLIKASVGARKKGDSVNGAPFDRSGENGSGVVPDRVVRRIERVRATLPEEKTYSAPYHPVQRETRGREPALQRHPGRLSPSRIA
jgi:hypothetical protein